MDLENLERTIKAVADKNRLRILKMLENRRLCVCQIAYVLNIKEASVSRHLKKMKAAGFIGSTQDGHWVYYYLKPENPYAAEMLGMIKNYLNTDSLIASDREKLKGAEKEVICNFRKS